MDFSSKKNLNETVSRQEEELKRYKKRFQDVVTAYKNLVKEKEALELSLKIMTDSNESPRGAKKPSSPSTREIEIVKGTKELDVPTIDPKTSELMTANHSSEELRTQLNNLVKSLSSLSAEKSRMEVCFQADRKQLRQEKEQEQERAAKAEEQVQRLAALHEERVANLESRLAELSSTVGTYDHLRQQDQIAIHKLKERLAQLEVERTGSGTNCIKCKADVDYEAVLSQLKLSKQLLPEASDMEGKFVKDAILMDELLDKSFDKITVDHSMCEQEYNLLKQEFENFKKQFSLGHEMFSKKSRDDDSNETTFLRNQIKNLKEKVRMLEKEISSSEQEFRSRLEQQQKVFEVERASLKEKYLLQENEFKVKLFTLEQQVVKQRERTIALVKEKEQEIHNLKDSMNFIIPSNSPKQDLDGKESPTSKSLFEGDSQKSNLSSLTSAVENPHMLHYAHELARRDADVSNLRQTKHKLEMTVRDLRRIIATERDQTSQNTAKLKDEISRLERCKSRESANLEYLKNVILSFLTSSNSDQKHHMLNAIAFVLKFSESETKQALSHLHK